MSQSTESLSANQVSPPSDKNEEARVRKTTLLVIAATLIFTGVATTFLEFESRSAHMAMSNLPLAVLLPFVFWLLGNTLLKRLFPRISMTTMEMRIMLCVLWVGASFAGYNWATQWVGSMAAPRYFASPENRWQELIFDYLPWWMYPSNLPGVVDRFYLGLGRDEILPWGAWFGPVFWALSAALAMTAIGVGLTAIFQKQWAEHERLTFPLAQVSLDLTEGFDRKPGWPPFMRSRIFWIGFAIAAFPLLWNLIEYWVPGFPRLAIFDTLGRRRTPPPRYLPWGYSYRLLPTAQATVCVHSTVAMESLAAGCRSAVLPWSPRPSYLAALIEQGMIDPIDEPRDLVAWCNAPGQRDSSQVAQDLFGRGAPALDFEALIEKLAAE